jgi:ABC-type multidrug transport system fused ATPase/permease subunit
MKRRLPCCRRKADDVKVASEQATVVKPEKPEMIKLSEILKYSSRNQKILVYFGVLFSVCSGAAAPWFSIIMGRCVAIYNPNSTALEMNDAIIEMVKIVAIVASILWACGYAQYAFMQHAAEKLAFELRQKYLSSLMR